MSLPGEVSIRRLLLAAVLTLIPLSAQAHTAEELDVWIEDWSRQSGIYPTDHALAELRDMMSRHTFPTPVETEPSGATSSASANSGGTNRGMGSGVEQWRDLVSNYSWDVNTALCLMAKESGGNPNAQNASSGASGLMQVLPSWAPKFGYKSDDLFDPAVNLEISYALYVDGGWNHWSPYLRGECR